MDEQMIARVMRNLRRLSLTQVRRSIVQSMARDSDVEVMRQTVSLRCPLSQSRIQNPCRFIGCNHFQCFDVTSFLLSGQTTQTQLPRCPVCDRSISGEALVIDLYFEDILKRAPATVDEVHLQTNGEWTIEGRGTEVIDINSRTSLDATVVGPAFEGERNGGEVAVHCSTSDPEGARLSNANQPNALPWGINPRENPSAPTLPPGAYPATELSRRATRTASTLLPRLSQPRLHSDGESLAPPLAREFGMGSWPDNRDHSGRLESQCDVAPPVQSSLGSDILKVAENSFLFLKGIGLGWLLWILTVLVDLIEGIITIQLSMIFTEYRDFNQAVLGNRVRLVCFASWWTMACLIAVIPIVIVWARSEPSRGPGAEAVLVVFVSTWIFWTAGAGSLTSLIWARKGPDCVIANFPYCKYTQGVLGLAWLIWIMVTVQGVYHLCAALRRNQSDQPPGDLVLEG